MELRKIFMTLEALEIGWKLNVFSIGKGMIPIGQFENDKPLKGITLMVMKFYWLKEFQIAKDISIFQIGIEVFGGF